MQTMADAKKIGREPTPLPPPRLRDEARATPRKKQQPIRPPRQRTAEPPPIVSETRPPLPRSNRHRGCLWFLAIFSLLSCGILILTTATVGALVYARLDGLVDERLVEFENYRGFASTFIYARNISPNPADNGNCQRSTQAENKPELLYEVFGEGRRQHIPLAQIPQALLDATVATEDEAFYHHFGIDIPATLQATWRFFSGDRSAPGGSTIHQQLVRNVLFSAEYRAERSIRRKLEEILLALALDRRYSKEQILEMYLNEIYFGNLAYGVQAAAQTFFCKDVQELNVGEGALLAGLPQAPANLDPLSSDPKVQAAVNERWQIVLAAMVENGYLSPQERAYISAEGLRFQPDTILLKAPHFTIHLLDELEDLLTSLDYQPDFITPDGQAIFGGFQVHSTLDTRLNALAQDAIVSQVCQGAKQQIGNGAALIIKPSSGEILAMVGSANFYSHELKVQNELVAYEYDEQGRCIAVHVVDGQVNVNTRARQPGSTIKPITYAAALERGLFTPGTVFWDTETHIPVAGQPDYTPRNYDGNFHGPMTLRSALANSYNIPAVQALRALGVEALLEILARFGVNSLGEDASQYGLSLTLGGGEITPLELTRAFTVFANQGRLLPSQSIRCILDEDENIVFQLDDACAHGQVITSAMLADCETQSEAERPNHCQLPAPSLLVESGGPAVLDARIAYLISDILSDETARRPAMGAEGALYIPGLRAAVKTGTTDNFKDNWTIGYTANVAVGVWVGNTRGEAMRNTSGLSGAAPIWKEILSTIYEDPTLLKLFSDTQGELRPEASIPPNAMTLQRICDLRRLTEPATHCAHTTVEWFLDTPAARPDAEGELRIPSSETEIRPNPSSAIELTEVSPSVFSLLVQPLPPAVGNSIDFGLPRENAPPPPIYCQLPNALTAQAPGAQTRLFIAPPFNAEDAIAAEIYARENGFPFLPTIVCTPELIAVARQHGGDIITAYIHQPAAGTEIAGNIPILGSAQFRPDQAQFYKLELRGGPHLDWTTLGSTHTQAIAAGQLEWLPALPSGDYQLRLVVIGWDGNFLQPPYEIAFRVP